jgi:hypothetical protein
MIVSRCLTLIDGCKTCGATGQVNVGTWKKWDPRRQGHIMGANSYGGFLE